MKNEVDLIKELWQENSELTEEELDKNFDEGFDLMREIAKSQNTKLLPDLLELFTDKNEDYGGVCETLMNDIWDNYSAEQIIEAISKKFDYLIENDLSRFACLCNILFNKEDFPKLRIMFNEIKSQKSKEFLEELDKWIDNEYEVGPNGVNLLREDMKKW